MPTPSDSAGQETNRYLVLCVVCLGSCLSPLSVAAVNVAIPSLASALQANAVLVDPSDVPATPPGFTPDSPITNPKTARSALAALSNTLVGVYADVASVTEGADRATAIAWAQASARDAVRWGVASQAFPT